MQPEDMPHCNQFLRMGQLCHLEVCLSAINSAGTRDGQVNLVNTAEAGPTSMNG